MLPLHYYWQIGHVGLAAATSVSAFLNALLLFIHLRKKGIYSPTTDWMGFFLALLLSVAAMVIALILVANQLQILDATLWHTLLWWQRLINIAVLCVAGFVAYCVCLFGCGFRLHDLYGPAKATSSE